MFSLLTFTEDFDELLKISGGILDRTDVELIPCHTEAFAQLTEIHSSATGDERDV